MSQPDNTNEPSGEKQQHKTQEDTVFLMNPLWLTKAPSFVLHNVREPSIEPDNTKEPSGEKQQRKTL